jgi:hypothetical protein
MQTLLFYYLLLIDICVKLEESEIHKFMFLHLFMDLLIIGGYHRIQFDHLMQFSPYYLLHNLT